MGSQGTLTLEWQKIAKVLQPGGFDVLGASRMLAIMRRIKKRPGRVLSSKQDTMGLGECGHVAAAGLSFYGERPGRRKVFSIEPDRGKDGSGALTRRENVKAVSLVHGTPRRQATRRSRGG